MTGPCSPVLYVTFPAVSYALLAEKAIRKLGAEAEILPVPRGISSSCGYAAAVRGLTVDELERALQDILWDGLYQTENDDRGRPTNYRQIRP